MNSFILETLLNSAKWKLSDDDKIEALSANGHSCIRLKLFHNYQGDYFLASFDKDGEIVAQETYSEGTDIFVLISAKLKEAQEKHKGLIIDEILRDFTQMTVAELMAKRDTMKCSQ